MGNEEKDEVLQGFTIDDDSKAEWALEKIKEATEERDRLLNLIKEKEAELAAKKAGITEKYERETGYLKGLLQQYMNTVECKSTKTQDTYQLLSGKLIRKKPTTEYKVDDEKLLAWLSDNGHEELIKTESKPRWGELKKLLTGDPESGLTMIEGTGELVDGVEAKLTEPKFDIKLG